MGMRGGGCRPRGVIMASRPGRTFATAKNGIVASHQGAGWGLAHGAEPAQWTVGVLLPLFLRPSKKA